VSATYQCFTISVKYIISYLDCEHSDTTGLLLLNNLTSVNPSPFNDFVTCIVHMQQCQH